MNRLLKQISLSLVLCISFIMPVHAEEESTGAASAQYYNLKPSFVANFGDTEGKKLKFVKADVAVKAYNGAAISEVMAHDALIRHQIVMMLSAQTEESLSTSMGQEALRTAILDRVKAVLKEETGKEHIDDLLFTSFVVQR